jgi:odorant receptor
MESLYFASCRSIGIHFDILRESYDGNNAKFVKQHKVLLDRIKDLSRFVQPVILTQFAVSSILLCFVGFQFVVLDDLFQKVVMIGFAASLIMQLLYYCFGGQEIKNKSEIVAADLYYCDMDLIMIIARAQKPAIFKFYFFEVNLETFSSIISSALSLITFLRSIF